MTATITHRLDQIRREIVGWLFAFPAAKRIFFNRAKRLSCLFALATLTSLFLSLFFPLWVLILGPMIYGFPHLIASLRYSHYSLSSNQPISGHAQLKILSVWFAFSALGRLSYDLGFFKLQSLPLGSPLPEILFISITLLITLWLYRKNALSMLRGIVAVSVFAYFAWEFPRESLGTMILLHNLIAFGFWYSACSTRQEKIHAGLATLSFITITAFIFLGLFDFLYQTITPQGQVLWAKLNFWNLGKDIIPWSKDYTLWWHAVVAYAFGQSLHYFVWLKAIPDECHDREIPTTFTRSWKLLKIDFGRTTFAIILFVVAGAAVWVIAAQPLARLIYFSIAAFHGYSELVALSLAPIKRC